MLPRHLPFVAPLHALSGSAWSGYLDSRAVPTMRCRTFCKCGRDGSVTGWAAGRPATAVPQPQAPSAAAPVEVEVVAPRGRPAALALEVLTATAWWAALLGAVSGADEVLVATFLFDHNGLTGLLLRRLRSRSPCVVTILVDREGMAERTCCHQRPRLRELRAAGADVYLCRGQAGLVACT